MSRNKLKRIVKWSGTLLPGALTDASSPRWRVARSWSENDPRERDFQVSINTVELASIAAETRTCVSFPRSRVGMPSLTLCVCSMGRASVLAYAYIDGT
jgi:hypothetical protein